MYKVNSLIALRVLPVAALRLLVGALAFALFLAACGGDQPRAKFATGSRVILIGSTSSLILRTGCASPFTQFAGVANVGDEAVILRREYCDEDWWYRVQVTALKEEDWQGIGWVNEANLKTK